MQAEQDLFCYERFEDWASKLHPQLLLLFDKEGGGEGLFSTILYIYIYTTTTAAAAAEEEKEEGQEQQQQQQAASC